MKLGTFMMPLHPPEKCRTECFEEDIEFTVMADDLGFEEAWIGQHHTLAWEPIPANDLFIANVLPRTKNIRLGTGVSIIPQHHPANVAVRLAMLDHLSRGRINCGFGQGGVPTDWELFDLPDPKTQGLMTVEGIDMILKLWEAEPPFDFQGDYWRIRVETPNADLGMGKMLQPYQKPHPPIAMSVIKGESMAARMAGQRDFIPLSTNLVPATTVVQHWATYCGGAADAGKPEPSREIWRISRSIYVGESTDEAWDHVLGGTFAGAFEYLIALLTSANMLDLLKPDPETPDSEVTPEFVARNLCVIGSVDDCLEQLEGLWDLTGGFGKLLMVAHDWDDKVKWQNCMKRLAQEIVPKLPSL